MNEITERAAEAAGNWQKFKSFCWHDVDSVEKPEQWTIVYTHNRDSDLLDQSNAEAIRERLRAYPDDVRDEHHGHFLCGWVDGYAIRVYDDDGKVTEAFQEWCAIQDRLEDYPILDEDDFCRREHDATMENVEEVTSRVWRWSDRDGDMPEDLPGEVYSWLWDNNQREVDPVDGGGGYPTDEAVEQAIVALGYPAPAEQE